MDIDKSAAPPSPRPKRSIKRCLAIFCILIACGIGAVISFTLYTVATTTIGAIRDPHKSLLYNGTITPTLSSNQVIKPLIDLETKFDLLLTVYVRIPNNETTSENQRLEYEFEYDWNPENYTGNELSLAAITGKSPVEIRYDPTEEIVFQGIVSKGLSLRDRDIERTVKFDLPLRRFYDRHIYPADVRAAVALIPNHPNKLERLVNFTNWRPEEIVPLPRIDSEFKSSALLNDQGEDDSTRWSALEHIALAFPLIEFHDQGDPCNTTALDLDEDDYEDDLYDSIRDEDDKERQISTESEAAFGEPKKSEKHLWRPIDPGMHPHLVTRSHIYLINETRLFDRKAYDAAHKHLRKTACGKSLPGGQVSRWLCNGAYQSVGHWANRFVLSPPEGKKNKELAYGPYLGNLDHGAGPKDVRPLPVTRHNCSTTTEPDPKHLSVNYTIRFSSLTPARVGILTHFVQSHRVEFNATEYEIAALHNNWEQSSGVFGSKTEGTHPIRRLLINIIRTFLAIPILILDLLYWYTRTTTVGINHTATYMSSGGILGASILPFLEDWKQEQEAFNYPLLILALLFELSPAILKLKAIAPFEIIRNGWRFSLKRWRWSHNERNSMRRGTGVDRKIWVAVFIAIFSSVYIPMKYDLAIIHPAIKPLEDPSTPKMLSANTIIISIYEALENLSSLLQILHNYNSKTFAGNYQITTYMVLGFRLTELVYHLPFVVGKFDIGYVLTCLMIIEIAVEVVLAYQAWCYPKIDQKAEEEE